LNPWALESVKDIKKLKTLIVGQSWVTGAEQKLKNYIHPCGRENIHHY
jgi:hypothetical protein